MNIASSLSPLYPEIPAILPLHSNSGIVIGISHSGPITLGTDIDKSIVVAGSPGGGKSKLCQSIVQQLPTNAWILDPKAEHRELLGAKPFIVIEAPSMFLDNLLKPPFGVPPKKWLYSFSEFFAASFAGLVLVKGMLIEIIDELYSIHRIYDGSNDFPTLKELAAHAATKRSKKFKRNTILDALEFRLQLLCTYFQDSLHVRRGYMDQLLFRNVIFELGNLPQELQNFFTQYCAFYQFVFRTHHRIPRPECQTLMVIDEGKRIADKSQDDTLEGSVSPWSYLLSQSRSFKLSFLVSTQEYHRLGSALKSSAMTTIAFNCHNFEDIIAISKTLGLDSNGIAVLRSLRVAQALVKKGWEPPQLVQVPEVRLPRNVPLDWMKAEYEKLLAQVVFADPAAEIIPPAQSSEETQLDRLILNAILLHPDYSETRLWKVLSIPFGSAFKRKEALKEKGLVGELSETIKPGRGGTAKFLYLVSKGYDAIGQIPKFKMRGGPRHYFWASIIRAKEESAGNKVEIEKALGHDGHAVDIWSTGKKTKAIEICISTQNLIETVQKLHASSADQAILAFPTQRIADQARAKVQEAGILPEEDLARFRFVPLYTFIDPLRFHGDIEPNQTENENSNQS